MVLLTVVACGVVGAGLLLLVGWLQRREARLLVAEFREHFPGRCMVCSYHRYGVLHGMVSGPPPEHDYCPESSSSVAGHTGGKVR